MHEQGSRDFQEVVIGLHTSVSLISIFSTKSPTQQ